MALMRRTISKKNVSLNLLRACISSGSANKANTSLMTVNGDLVGQPNPISNLRPIIFHIPEKESDVERQFRLERELVQNWNEEFWTAHNSKFLKERREFLTMAQSKNPPNEPISADDMSIFYKAFLDKYWENHLSYNFQWYKKNIKLASLALQVKIHRLKCHFLGY